MRKLVLAAVLLTPLALAADDRVEDVLRQAIAASGGSEVHEKYPAGRVLGHGTMTFAGVETEFTFEQAYHFTGRFRTVVRCEVQGQKWELLQVVNEGVAKQTINGRVIPITDATAKEVRTAALLNEIVEVSPLLLDRKFSSKLDKQPKGPDAAGVVVSVKGFPEFRCTFDRKSGHLVRIAYKGLDLDSVKESDLETSYDDFKAVSGITRPTHAVVTRDGKKVVELRVEKYTPLERIDPAAFKIPSEKLMASIVFVVDRRESGHTLAAVLKSRYGLSWSQAKRLVERRHVKVSGQVETDVTRRLKPGKRVELAAGTIEVQKTDNPKPVATNMQPATPKPAKNRSITPPKQTPTPAANARTGGERNDIEIVYADDSIVVVNKPAGLTTMRHKEEAAEFGERGKKFLPATLADLLPRLLGSPNKPVIAVHRIDRDTSGLVVFARTRTAAESLGRQFRKHTVDRRYRALTRGIPVAGRVESVLVRDRGDGRRGSTSDTTQRTDGKRAVTHLRVIEARGQYALVECRLETGRTHQVRIHLGEAGAPLCGERVYDRPLYGQPLPDGSAAPRPMLHAERLGFVHPHTGVEMLWEVPAPADFEWMTR